MDHSSETCVESALLAYYTGQPFTEFDRCTRRALTNLAFLMVASSTPGRRQLAEDAVQDALARVAATCSHARHRWNPARGSLRGWLTTILRRCVLNRIRGKHGREIPLTDQEGRNGDDDDSSPAAKLLADGPEPGELAEFNELLQALADCVAVLSEELRHAVKLKFQGGLQQRDIAQRLGVSPSTVTRMFDDKAYPLLRDCLRGKGFLPSEL